VSFHRARGPDAARLSHGAAAAPLAMTFIWSALISALVYGESAKAVHVAGMELLIAGMYCMGR
jgi:multidrug transporter EmrE-like cation transporter